MIGRVYKIIVGQGTECYIGSTFDELRFRFQRHKAQYRGWLKRKTRGCTSFELFDKYGVENCKIMLIKEYEVEDRRHLEAYETLWICKLKGINKVLPCNYLKREKAKERNKAYYDANRDKEKERKKKYREANRDKVNERNKAYYDANRDKVNERNKAYREANPEKVNERNKAYREANPEKVNERKKKYYDANRDKENERGKTYREANSQLVECECGSVVKKYALKDHIKTKKHISFSQQ